MRAGKMDRLIQIDKLVSTRDTFGAEVPQWQKLCSVWCEVVSERGQEKLESAQEVARDNLLFRIRYRTDVKRSYRIQYNREFYDIKSITEIGRRDGLEIFAEAIRL